MLISLRSLARLRNKVKNHSLVVASYDIVRNDGDFFRLVVILRLFTPIYRTSCCSFFNYLIFFLSITLIDHSTGITVCLMKDISSRMGKQRYAVLICVSQFRQYPSFPFGVRTSGVLLYVEKLPKRLNPIIDLLLCGDKA